MAARRERGLFDPEAGRGREPVRPPHLRDRLRRRPGGRRLVRGLVAGRSPEARQPDGDLRRQQDLDRGRHQHRVLRGRRGPLRGVRLGRPRASTGPTAAPATTRTSQALYDAIEAGNAVTDKPTFIQLRTIIGWPAPTKQNTGKVHGSAARRRRGRRDQEGPRLRPGADLRGRRRRHRPHPRGRSTAARRSQAEWTDEVRRLEGREPRAGRAARPAREARTAGRLAGRAAELGRPTPRVSPPASASGEVLTKLAPELPELWGGSADLAGSNNTTPKGQPSFIPAEHADQGVPGQRVRPGAALRHPRARHGLGPERHRPARRHPPVRRHVPGLLATTCARRSGWPR